MTSSPFSSRRSSGVTSIVISSSDSPRRTPSATARYMFPVSTNRQPNVPSERTSDGRLARCRRSVDCDLHDAPFLSEPRDPTFVGRATCTSQLGRAPRAPRLRRALPRRHERTVERRPAPAHPVVEGALLLAAACDDVPNGGQLRPHGERRREQVIASESLAPPPEVNVPSHAA